MTAFVRRAVWLFAVAWFTYVAYAGLQASRHQLRIAFQYSKWTTVDSELAHELTELREHVPQGSTVLVLSGPSGDDAWIIGMWQRSLYPSYNLIRIITSPQDAARFVQEYRTQTAAHWVLFSRTPMSTLPLEWSLRLNPHSDVFPMVLGRLPE